MIVWRLIVGVVFIIGSGFFSDMLLDLFNNPQLIYEGTDYAKEILQRVLDAVGGSLCIWGFLKNPKR